MDVGNFDVEHLQKIVYERSRTWSTFLEDVKEKETFDELSVSQLDDIIGSEFDEEDSNDELASIEENDGHESLQLDPELCEKLSNATRLTLLINNSTLALKENATKEEADFVDLVNQTMPIIYEHNRQLKETGFDSILSTFDKTKIEEKVGSWLNRHNSLFGGDSTQAIVCAEQNNDGEKDSLTERNKNGGRAINYNKSSSKSPEESYNSDDSLQSGETARYIRSSKMGYLKKSTCKTMIKKHCLLTTVRDSLKEKYAGDSNSDDDYPLNTIYYKMTNKYECHPKHYNLTKKSANKTNIRHKTTSEGKQRRKVLRKRIVTQNYNSDDFSDSDFYDDYAEHSLCRNFAVCCHTNHCSSVHKTCSKVKGPTSVVKRSKCSAKKISLARQNRRYYYFRKQSESLSSSTSSSNSFNGSRDKRSLQIDDSPCTRLSEHKHRNNIKLCEKYKHNGDTESRYVDQYENKITQIKNKNLTGDENVEKSSRQVKSFTNSTDNATFLTATQIQVIYNSTAMSCNSPAGKRQISNTIQPQKTEKGTEECIPNKKSKLKRAENIAKQKSSSTNAFVTSTSNRSPKQSIDNKSSVITISDDEQSDCTLVTSTTNHNLLDNAKSILVYTPNNPSSLHAHQSTGNDGYFTITKEHLSSALGEKLAKKFLKYYVGRRRFNVNSTIYYIPPKIKSIENVLSTSGSDDCLDNLGQYGDLYECL